MANPFKSGVKPRIAISLGDFNGIGTEVVLKSLLESKEDFIPVLIGTSAAIDYYSDALALDLLGRFALVQVETTGDIRPGQLSKEAGKVAMESVEKGIELCMNDQADALVTAPISKEAIHLAGYDFPGHTEFLAHKTSADRVLMIMISGELRVCVFTKHIPIVEVASKMVQSDLVADLNLLSKTLLEDFSIDCPKIAVMGLNPHAGEGGDIGREEIDIILPAIQDAKDTNGSVVFDGPFPADGFFGTKSQENYDAIMAMYHDQGLVPFKALSFNRGVNFTGGLPIVRTSPDHGTAFGIAGKGIAESGSMQAAIRLAIEVAKKRTEKKA